MGRFTRHGMDEQPLEGGARGGGSSTFKEVGLPLAGIGSFAGAAKMTMDATKERAEKDRQSAAEIKRESRGVEKSNTDRAREAAKEMADEEKYTKKTKEQNYAKGGMTASSRADGIAQRGKTRGTMIMCGGGMARGKK
jgi:hypothetical protein